jgi:protein-S-isoprenylcysteine O-methyltransferase Ste14
MTLTERLFVWTGGALFVGSLAVTAWWWTFSLAAPPLFAGWPAIVYDAALFSAFALHHSVFARRPVKTALSRRVADRLIRSIYVWAASLLLIAVCLLWRPVGGTLYSVIGWRASVHLAAQVIGLLLIGFSVRAIDPLELAGIRTGTRRAVAPSLQVGGPYRLVRHPVYLGWLLIVFGIARMNGDRLLFALISTFYLIVAIRWEERSLQDEFGEAYTRYTRDVRWRVVPYLY